jgi:hypothetical protein
METGPLRYRVLAKTQSPNTMAVKISIIQAASPQPHRMSASPATVTGPNSATLDFGDIWYALES